MINHQRMGFTPTTNMVYVNGEKELDNYPVTPGYTLWAKDLQAPIVYIKAVDLAGMTTKRIIDLNERTSNSLQAEYVTKADFEELKSELKSDIKQLLAPKTSKSKEKVGETDA